MLIDGSKIAAVGGRSSVPIPENTRSIDCSGMTVTAGFWNSHVHFFERKWLDAANLPAPELSLQLDDVFTRFGFTSVFDIGSMWTNTRVIRDRIESGDVRGPRIRSTGEGLVPPGALPPDLVLQMMGVMKFPAPEVADAPQAADAARKLLDDGVDGIKMFVSSPRGGSLSGDVIQAAAGEAHLRGKPVFAHVNRGEDVLTAVRNGVDVIAHTTPSAGPWDETIVKTMAERRVALTPTLTLWKFFSRHDRLSAHEQIVGTAVSQLRAWVASGGTVLFGTDLGAVDCDPTEEYVLMAAAGMTFPEILASLTTAPAERFGESTRLGRVAAGLAADLVILKGDPSNDIRALGAVQHTLRDGKVVTESPV
ncbi:MAG TPA: amidohydrolase family protein [Thermoanaerobaculia bacterium]|nr:amidohydrolase family protein [Thermoanaerobaculia bacterium]